MPTSVIFNPSARGQKAAKLCARLEKLLPHCTCERSQQAGHARELAATAVNKGFDTVIAAGGDGTVNEVVNGIADAGGLAKTSFGVLPLGTINVFSRELGYPRSHTKVIAMLHAGKTMQIDLGQAEFLVDGQKRQRLFVQLAGAGLDSRAIELVSWELKKRFGPLAYLLAGWRALAEKQPVIVAHGRTAVAGELALIGNGRFYGGSFPVFPAASLQDGLLDICVFPKVNVTKLFSVAPQLLTGRFGRTPSPWHLSLPSVQLSSESRVQLQLDGDNVCELPVSLTVLPGALRVIVP